MTNPIAKAVPDAAEASTSHFAGIGPLMNLPFNPGTVVSVTLS
jgi:hypothetical protein